MSKSNFSEEFKRDAVRQITERGYPVAEVSQRLGVSPHSLYEWKKKFEPPRVYRRVKLSKDEPYDTEKTHPVLHG